MATECRDMVLGCGLGLAALVLVLWPCLPLGLWSMAPEVQWCLGQSWSYYPAYAIVGLVWPFGDGTVLGLSLQGSFGLSRELLPFMGAWLPMEIGLEASQWWSRQTQDPDVVSRWPVWTLNVG